MKFARLTLAFAFLLVSVGCYEPTVGPLVKATKGEVWPKPLNQAKTNSYYILRPQTFRFSTIGSNCAILENAIERYYDIISKSGFYELDGGDHGPQFVKEEFVTNDTNYLGFFDRLDVYLSKPCSDNELPHLNMDEKYNLTTKKPNPELNAASIWGILRGLETFTHLFYLGDDLTFIRLNATVIQDQPRFSHRGLMLDTSRHYLPVYSILKTLDGMAYNKFNVFHWHLTDDQSFPFQSRKFPELSNLGAYHPTKRIYSPGDVQKVIEYARLRGIRVIAEFDTPGHTMCWGEGVPALLTKCYKNGKPDGQVGPIDPTKNFTYSFLADFFDEVVKVFPDKYVHLGGDEVEYDCWKSNPDVNAFMASRNISGNYKALESYYIQNLINIADKLKASSLVWEEVFINGAKLPNSTVVHVWRPNHEKTMAEVTKAGKPALLSSCWYLDHLAKDLRWDWKKFYACEPTNFTGTADQIKLVMGGETCMWAEVVNEGNVESRVWPRASAVAEKLWSIKDADSVAYAEKRIEEHACRMNRRNLRAEPPNAQGVCL